MKLVIHDLKTEEWDALSAEFGDCTVISDNGTIKPCTGCFGCWAKDPGRCAVKDGYDNMGYLIHHADEVVVISRYTYGGFSHFVKNVFDRSLAYVLPQFEIVGGESHHKKRYEEDKPFTFIFYGKDLSEEEKNCARRYVKAVCTNIRGYVKDVIFRDGESLPPADLPQSSEASDKVLILNGSMRYAKGNSAALAEALSARLGLENKTIALCRHLSDMQSLFPQVEKAGTLVLCVPLYVDGLPAQMIRFMELMQSGYRGGRKKVCVLANMGLYESGQLVNLFEAVRQWCQAMGFEYCGGLGVSAGEMIGVLMRKLRFGIGPTRTAAKGVEVLAKAIESGSSMEDIYAQPGRFPRWLYLAIANNNWNRIAKNNGIRPEDIYRKL